MALDPQTEACLHDHHGWLVGQADAAWDAYRRDDHGDSTETQAYFERYIAYQHLAWDLRDFLAGRSKETPPCPAP